MPIFKKKNITSVLITGGKGFIGSALKYQLEIKGYKVISLSRRKSSWETNVVTWNDIINNGFYGCQAIVNLVGENILNPLKRWNPSYKSEVYNSRVQNTALIAKEIRKAAVKPKLFISMSGVGIYKPDKDKVYDEYSDIGGTHDFVSHLAQHWEEAANISGSVRNVILRSGVVLGRSGGMIKQIYPPFLLGFGGTLGNGSQYFPWIHIEDICRLIIHSIENEEISGVLNAVAPQIITNKEFTKAFGRALHRPTIFPTPEFVIEWIFGKERSVMLLKGQKVVPKRALEEFNFKYRYADIDEACKSLVK